MAHMMEAGDPAQYSVSILTSPSVPVPDQNATLRVAIAHADGTPVRFETMHTRLLHVMIIRDDLQYFVHLHAGNEAAGAASGTFALEHVFPAPGKYRAMVEFMEDGKAIAKPVDLVVPGAYEPVPLGTDFSRIKIVNNYTVTLTAPDSLSVWGQKMFVFTISKDGVPVANLEDYLGEKMHLAVWGEGLSHFEHAHPAEMRPGGTMFHLRFPSPGLYKLYPQFQINGTVMTAEFLVKVD
jgi:hypothetical protein